MIRLEFKLQDLWIGLYWKKVSGRFDLWLCILPCLPIHYWREWKSWDNTSNTLIGLEDRHKTARNRSYPRKGWTQNGNDFIRDDQ